MKVRVRFFFVVAAGVAAGAGSRPRASGSGSLVGRRGPRVSGRERTGASEGVGVCAKPQTLKAMGGCSTLNPKTSEWLRNLRTVRNPEPYKK